MKTVDSCAQWTATLLILTVFLSLTSCIKRKCKDGDSNGGIIVNYFNDYYEKISSDGVAISDSASFKQIFPNRPLPIDFNNYSLLCIYTDGGGCHVSVDREVTKLDSEKQYHYTIHIYACGMCKKLWISPNVVSVPKLPTGWTATFEVKRN